MRMNDYEFDFVTDSAQKKNIARSARSTRTHCGKRGAVKFPSDYLTKKEIKAMSGECIKYASLKNPMNWEEFKELPDDLKKEYISGIRERFEAPDKCIAEMFGVCAKTLSLYLADLKCNGGSESRGRRTWKKEEFYAWIGGADLNADVAPVVEEATVESENATDSSILSDNNTQCVSNEKICATPVDGHMVFECPADQAFNMLGLVLGNTKVRLHVKWEIVRDDDEEDLDMT